MHVLPLTRSSSKLSGMTDATSENILQLVAAWIKLIHSLYLASNLYCAVVPNINSVISGMGSFHHYSICPVLQIAEAKNPPLLFAYDWHFFKLDDDIHEILETNLRLCSTLAFFFVSFNRSFVIRSSVTGCWACRCLPQVFRSETEWNRAEPFCFLHYFLFLV